MYCSPHLSSTLGTLTLSVDNKEGSLLTMVTIISLRVTSQGSRAHVFPRTHSLTSLQNHFVPPPGPGLGSGVSVRCRSRSRSLGSGQLIGAVTLALMGTTLVIITELDNFNFNNSYTLLDSTLFRTVFVLNERKI